MGVRLGFQEESLEDIQVRKRAERSPERVTDCGPRKSSRKCQEMGASRPQGLAAPSSQRREEQSREGQKVTIPWVGLQTTGHLLCAALTE